MSLIEELRSDALRAAEAFDALAEKVADGGEIDRSTARMVLAASYKTPDDLQAAVARVRRIRELQAVVATLPDLEHRREALTNERARQLKLEQDELREVRDRHGRTGGAFQGAINMLRMEIVRVRTAKKELDTLVNPPAPPEPPGPPVQQFMVGRALPSETRQDYAGVFNLPPEP